MYNIPVGEALINFFYERFIKMSKFEVKLSKLIDAFDFEIAHMPKPADEISIIKNDISRPGLQLEGFYEYFDETRIQILGKMEYAFLATLDPETRYKRLEALMSKNIPALVITQGFEPLPEIVTLAKITDTPVLLSKESTSEILTKIVQLLNVELAPRITRHGVLIEVYGEGMLILGESGVGKSETAVELIKRGHRLVADDAVEIRKTSNDTLIGSSPDNIRHFLEIRGIGIINARRLFGMGAVKVSEKINMVIQLELWDSQKTYDRMGIDEEFTEILGVKIPSLTIPVKPGRNLAVILEVAAMNNREKKFGYNGAQELLKKLGMEMDSTQSVTVWEDF